MAQDIFGHSARAAGLSEKKNQIDGLKAKAGDITVQQYHRGFASSAFDITISHTLQKIFIEIAMEEAGVVAEEGHDRKLKKSLDLCQREGIHFVPLAWESTKEVQLRRCTRLFASGPSWRVRGGYPAFLIRHNLYAQISCCHLAQAVIDRRLELACDRAL